MAFGGDLLFSSSSSSADTAFARGELRTGRVLGLPIPIPNGEVEGAPGVANDGLEATAAALGSFTGVLGGVVLCSRAGVAFGDGEGDASSSASPETSIEGTSG